MDTPVWVTILVSLITAIGGTGLGAWLLNIYNARNKHQLDAEKSKNDHVLAGEKQEREIKLAENEQAIKIYRELFEGLKKDIIKLTTDMERLEKEHLNCREENAQLKADMRNAQKEIDYLKIQANIKTNPLNVQPIIEVKK